MRFVNRSEVPIPEVLSDETGTGNKEKLKAIEHYNKCFVNDVIDLKTSAKFSFKAYKHKSIKQALEILFKGKCAYCESRYINIHPVDIEHWRPKAEVITDSEGKIKRHGYYWLASEWTNLLPSCIDCNRIRTHFDYLEEKEINLGKGNWFPLAVEANRSVKHNSATNEEPLLLNPCQDDPELYLQFHEEGFVSAKANETAQNRQKAEASIRFYALNRTDLVQARREMILLIQQKFSNIRALAKCLEQPDLADELTHIIEELLSYELERLEKFMAPDQPFSQMAKQVIDLLKTRYI